MSGQQQQYRNLPAVAAISAAVLALSLGDSLIKALGVSMPLWQLFVLRSLIGLVLLLGIGIATGKAIKQACIPRRPGWTALRSVMLAALWTFYYTAVAKVPLATVSAVAYTSPIFIAVLAVLFKGERLSLIRIAAVLGGFIGVLLVLQPNPATFDPYALLPLLSAILYAGGMILTGTKCAEEDPFCLVVSLVLAFLAVGAGLGIGSLANIGGEGSTFLAQRLLSPWVAVGWVELLAMLGLALSMLVGAMGAAYAYQVGRATTVACFDYLYLVFVVLWGWVFFAERTDFIGIAGIALIVVGGLMTLDRKNGRASD